MKIIQEGAPPDMGALTQDGQSTNVTQHIRWQKMVDAKSKAMEKIMEKRKKMIPALAMILALGMGVVKTAGATATNPADLDLEVTFNGQLSVVVDGVGTSSATLYAYSAAGAAAGNPGGNVYASPIDSDTVTNNGSIVEKWELDTSTIAGGGNWELTDATGTAAPAPNGQGQEACQGTCPGANQYAIQALFVSSNTAAGAYNTGGCPWPGATDWNGYVSTVPAHQGWSSLAANPTMNYNIYTSTTLADPATVAFATGLPDSSQVGLTGQAGSGDMLPLNDQIAGTGKRGLCVRVTMPSGSTSALAQEIQLEITAIGG